MKLKLLLALFLVIIIGAVLGANAYLQSVWTAPRLTETSLYTLKSGQSLEQAFHSLVPISSQERVAVKLYLKLHPKLAAVKAGTYQLPENAGFNQISAILRSGQVYQYRITLVEGETFSQWWQRLKAAPGIATTELTSKQLTAMITSEHSKLEGLLLPETYYYTHGTKPEAVVRRAYAAMEQVLEENWQAREDDLPIKTSYQLLILASLIEKETAIVDEMPLVASVFVNRLNHYMRLQTDPTVIYGLGEKFQGRITRQDLKSKTPYNTYVIRGLPPTPIAMPGRAAIYAAAHPAHTNYYYFVADGSGGHHFSKSLKEHNRAVRKYILNHE